MKRRCNNTADQYFVSYGHRGISVCERWQRFEHFYADMGPRPSSKHTLDRIDSDGNYEPKNCRWALQVEQQNNRRNNLWFEHDGRRQTMAQWARELNMDQRLLRYHLVKKQRSVADVAAARNKRA